MSRGKACEAVQNINDVVNDRRTYLEGKFGEVIDSAVRGLARQVDLDLLSDRSEEADQPLPVVVRSAWSTLSTFLQLLAMAVGSTPSIASIGIIGQHDNPLHIALFPPHEDELLDMSFVLNSSLDIFDIRLKNKMLDQELGLLHAIDERIATYGYLTNTGIKFIIIVDMLGRPPDAAAESAAGRNSQPVIGLRDADLKPAFKAIHSAYIRLLMNPFYTPEERTPIQTLNATGKVAEITSKKFTVEMQRIGRVWYPGIPNI